MSTRMSSNYKRCPHLPYPRRLPSASAHKLQRGCNPLGSLLMPWSLGCLPRSPAGHGHPPQALCHLYGESAQPSIPAWPGYLNPLGKCSITCPLPVSLQMPTAICLPAALSWPPPTSTRVAMPAVSWPQTLLKIFQACTGELGFKSAASGAV